jgi:hypothetical protein
MTLSQGLAYLGSVGIGISVAISPGSFGEARGR